MANPDSAEARGRIARWPLVRLVAYTAVVVGVIIAATIATRLLVPPAPSPWHDLVWLKNVLLPAAIVAIYAGAVALMERRPASEVSPRKGLASFFIGLVIGAGLIGAAYLILLKLGMAEISMGAGWAGLAPALVIPMVTAIGEELVFRVIFFGVLEEIVGSLAAIVISSAVFGLAHAANPGANAFALLALSLEMGAMLSLAYMLTRNIWIAVGIHAAWNFTLSFVFGAENSGVRDPFNYFQTTLSGPEILTGGLFGIEASIITLGLSVVVSSILLGLVLSRRQWKGLRFRLGRAPTESVAAI